VSIRYSHEKSTYFRFENMRSGAIKTEKGWNVQDFATWLFNPNSEEITVIWLMTSDDPNFVFANGQVGSYTKIYHLEPLESWGSLVDPFALATVAPRLRPFRLEPGAEGQFAFAVQGDMGSLWAVAKVMWYGRVQYAQETDWL